MAQGYLQVDVVSDANSFPVQDADIVIARTEEPDKIIEETEQFRTDGESSIRCTTVRAFIVTGGDGASICRIHDPNHSTGI